MPKNDIPAPVCITCKKSCSKDYKPDTTVHLCSNCGTEMKYMPAGELLNSDGRSIKENNGWVVSFSVRSPVIQSSRAMYILGVLIVILSVSFVCFGKITSDAALWSIASGILLTIIGIRRMIVQKAKTRRTLGQFPYWIR